MVKEAQGFYCEKCRRFMLNEEDMNSHLRTITHYRNFVQEAKVIINNAEEAAKKAAEEAAEKVFSLYFIFKGFIPIELNYFLDN